MMKTMLGVDIGAPEKFKIWVVARPEKSDNKSI
jgi:hypothetical protein